MGLCVCLLATNRLQGGFFFLSQMLQWAKAQTSQWWWLPSFSETPTSAVATMCSGVWGSAGFAATKVCTLDQLPWLPHWYHTIDLPGVRPCMFIERIDRDGHITSHNRRPQHTHTLSLPLSLTHTHSLSLTHTHIHTYTHPRFSPNKP